MPLIKAVLFDYGDTLVVTRKSNPELVSKAMKESYLAFKEFGLGRSYAEFADLDRGVFQRYMEEERERERDIPDELKYVELAGILLPELAAVRRRKAAGTANKAFWDAIANGYELRRDAKASLRELEKRAIKMAVVSNHHNGVALRAHLDGLGVSKYFTYVVASCELSYRKPDARIFRRALRAIGARSGEAAYVGDSQKNDVNGAKGAGMLAIWMSGANREGRVETTDAHPDYTVSSLRGVLEVVDRVNG